MINLQNISIHFPSISILENANLFIDKGQKAGLVAPNGAGKTTLLQAILGKQDFSGKIELAKNLLLVSVAQHLSNLDKSPLSHVIDSHQERSFLLKQLENKNISTEQIADIYERLITIDAYSAEARASNILKGLGFDDVMQKKPLNTLSGGWQMRVALASALFVPSDLLLLDEPTNHLDLEATIWLENFLINYKGTIILISHDRNFLNNVCDHIIYLNAKKLEIYKGNYDAFIKNKAMKLNLLAKNVAKIEEKRKHIQKFIDRFKAKATKAKQAQSRIKMLAKLQEISLLPKDPETIFDFPEPQKVSPPLLKIENASTGYDGTIVLKKLNIVLNPLDKIAVLGKNGNGKSTLAKLIAKKIPLMSGNIFFANNLKIAYFAQNLLETEINKNNTPFEHIFKKMQLLGKNPLRKNILAHLAKYGIVSCADTSCSCISGGQLSRLMLALICLDNPNLLILDEPTNHLDIDARDALIDALNSYEGTIILITHDFHLIETTADTLWLVHNHECKPFDGDINDYRNFLLKNKENESLIKNSSKKDSNNNKKIKNVPLDKVINTLEKKLADLNQARNDLYQKIFETENCQKIQENIDTLDKNIAELENDLLDKMIQLENQKKSIK